ncbi:hypothetical protein GOODEAATRI_008185 [Goodea atripinnis]|uniref:UCH37-like C-terminal domain-containing protein n=1 Tax=Goodea atripinnis TaxID=208336 RepID=A0ABV0MQC0_9TELE
MSYSEGEIRFNLMAIVSDRKMVYEKKIAELQAQLTEIENIRRKHNYLPFIMELLKTLAEYQQLIPLVEKLTTPALIDTGLSLKLTSLSCRYTEHIVHLFTLWQQGTGLRGEQTVSGAASLCPGCCQLLQ